MQFGLYLFQQIFRWNLAYSLWGFQRNKAKQARGAREKDQTCFLSETPNFLNSRFSSRLAGSSPCSKQHSPTYSCPRVHCRVACQHSSFRISTGYALPGRYLTSLPTNWHLPLAFPADYLHPSHCHVKLPSRSAGYSDLPAYSQILLRLANTNLRTVIVTAAVHWGFSSKLRLAADLSL